MKQTIITLSVAVATLFAFSSCQKEDLENNCSTSGVRIITGTFENGGTKTTLSDDLTPKWYEGDVIRILSSGAYKDVTLEAGSGTPAEGKGIINVNGSITIAIPTAMTGTLYAVYPASATDMTSCTDGNITFTIPAVQDGTFGSANICVAKSTATDGTNKDNLVFRNATAVLEITTAANVVGVDITAANKIAGPVTASFSGTTLNLTTSSLDKTSVSAVGTSAPSGNVFYLAAAPGTTDNTTVTCYKIDMKGSTNKASKDLKENVIYSMNLSSGVNFDTVNDLTGQHGTLNGHEYVIIKAKYDGTNYSYLKWSTMNLGATSPQEYGNLYSWGNPTGQSGDDNYNPSFTEDNYKNTEGYQINNTDYPWTKMKHDAAYNAWGGAWRMPTGGDAGEFHALTNATYWEWDGTDKGYYVYAPQFEADAGGLNRKQSDGETDVIGTYNKSTALLFFPVAGSSDGDSRYEGDPDDPNDGPYGGYWSSSLDSSDLEFAYTLYFVSSYVNPQCNYTFRYAGWSVRSVSD